jgi:hypothetical protein
MVAGGGGFKCLEGRGGRGIGILNIELTMRPRFALRAAFGSLSRSARLRIGNDEVGNVGEASGEL